MEPEGSVSRFPVPSGNLLPDMSAFFKGFAASLLFREGSHSVSFSSMLSEMVSKEVESRLAPNPVSLSVSSLLSVHDTAPAQNRVYNHSKLVCRRGVNEGRRGPWVV